MTGGEEARYDLVAEDYVAEHPDVYDAEPTATLLSAIGAPNLSAHVLDLACGHGLIARELARRGATVTGVDLSAALIATARAKEQTTPLGVRYVIGDAADPRLLEGRRFDIAVSNFGLTDIDDLDGALRTVARLLEPAGSFVFSILHPCFPGSPPKVSASWPPGEGYFAARRWFSDAPHSTLRAAVGSNHRPLSTYFNALGSNGLIIRRVDEPQPSDDWTQTVGLREPMPTYLVVTCRSTP